MGNDHIVPLSRQALSILNLIKPLTSTSRYVFTSNRTLARPLSENTLNAALRSLGYTKKQATAHGFRATARTLLDEILNLRVEIIEMQLAHQVRDVHGTAYNRTKFLDERKRMMQQYSDFLDDLKAGTGAKILPFKKLVNE